MIAMMLLSAVAAIGLLWLYSLAFPAALPLAAQAQQWQRSRTRAERRAHLELTQDRQTWSQRVAEFVIDHLRTRRPDGMQTYERDLAVTERSVEAWLAKLLVWATGGFFAGTGLVALGNAAGLGVPLIAGPALGLMLAGVATWGEVLGLREDATARREQLIDALSDVLDLVVMKVEGGTSPADALPSITEKGAGWAFNTLHDAIDNARPNGMTPWQALGEVGDRYGVVELLDLRASLQMAQDEGSSIRNTLIARAQSMREARLAVSLGRATRSTEAMRLTTIGMAFVASAYIILARVLFLFSA